MCIKIFNITQVDIFLKNGATAIGSGLGNKNKTYVEFKENKIFEQLMQRWKAKEF